MTLMIPSPSPATVDEALILVGDIVGQYCYEPSAIAHLRDPLRALSRCARREALPPERMLVRIKQALSELPVFSALPPEHRDELRTRVIEAAIRIFFSEVI